MPSTSGPLRIAFLGCGFITRVHSRNLRALGSACRLQLRQPGSRAKAEEYCRRYQGHRHAIPDYARRSTIPRSTRWSSRCRRASTSISRCRRWRPASTCWSRSRRFRAWRTTATVARGAQSRGPRGARRRERSLQAARRRAAQAAGRGRDWRHGVRALHDDRAAAEDRRRLAQRRGAWPAATRSSKRASTGCTSPAASARRITQHRRATGRRCRASGPDSARQEHDGGVPLRQRRGRLAVLLARDSVAAAEACGCRSCSAAKGVITFESNGAFVLVAGQRRCRG